MKWILTGSLIAVLSLSLWGQESKLRPYKLINSDTLRVQKINDEYVSHLIGNVNFFYGETEFYADEAVLYELQKISRMFGNVRVYDDTLSLFADEAEYFRLEEKVVLSGNVLAREVHSDSTIRTFAADEIEYLRNDRVLEALGRVQAYDEREAVRGFCGDLKYYQEEGYGYLLINPRIILEARDSLNLSAEKIEYFAEFKKIAANFNVRTESADFTITSDFLLYFSEMSEAIYLGEPEFRSEFADAEASEFRIYFDNKKISRAELMDFCQVNFKTEDQIIKGNWVTADEMEFNFSDGEINIFTARGNVDSFFRQEESEDSDFSENTAVGKEMRVIFEDNKVLQISMKDQVRGKYKFLQ
ncbi:MAG: hypothetical protein APR54_09220 [Candidatus Cloacimonas sp. SDB]|nr:MAG: hypothetical protein APR54_09220 [Candidatus Cloacimonas sp. SDB]